MRICLACNIPGQVEVKGHFQYLPKYLILSFGRHVKHKVLTKSSRSLTFQKEMRIPLGTQDNSLKYNLRAVIVHHGTRTNSGHYTCYVTTSTRDFHYDDGKVEVVQGDYINLPYVKKNVTLLLYETRDIQVHALSLRKTETPKPASYDFDLPSHQSKENVVDKPDLERLTHGQWLDDSIINRYLTLVTLHTKEVVAIQTLFSTVATYQGYYKAQKYLPKKNVLEADAVLLPWNIHHHHWMLLVIFPKLKEIRFLDSMGRNSDDIVENTVWLNLHAHAQNHGQTLTQSEWKRMTSHDSQMPRQYNGTDCGVFVAMAARFAAEQKVPSFKQEDIPKLRGRMAVELCYKSLLPIKPINSCITETNQEVKELKSSNVTKTFPNVEELESSNVTKTFPNVEELESSNVTKTFPKVEELERMMEDSSDDDTSHYSFVLSDDEEYNEEYKYNYEYVKSVMNVERLRDIANQRQPFMRHERFWASSKERDKLKRMGTFGPLLKWSAYKRADFVTEIRDILTKGQTKINVTMSYVLSVSLPELMTQVIMDTEDISAKEAEDRL